MNLLGRHHFSGLTPRRLSEGGEAVDDDEHSILEGCLALEEELGVMEQRALSSSGGYSPSQITDIVSMLSETAAGKESTQEHLPTEGHLQFAQQLLEPRAVFQPTYGEMVPPHTSSLQTSVKSPEPAGVVPALDPDSWLDSIPSISVQEGFGSSLVTEDHSGTELESGPPASKKQRIEDPGDALGSNINHPYVRLPVLQPGVVPRNVNVSILFSRPPMRLSLHVHLRTFRALFAKKALNQHDANVLVGAVERVVTTSWLQSKSGPRHYLPLFIVEALGYYFLALDAIVCAKHVLGDRMQLHLWWRKFINSFYTDYPLHPSKGKSPKKVPEFHKNLARRLVAAIEIYKRGERPPLSEIIELKTLLFCSPFGRHRLKDPMWDPWREDAQWS
ncbi:hypothetical protein, conserved [Eimeria brunetti]|uniref:Uncharacterized protein n=1 Tax=Eimeria brunetti TaxID=51314 RepID=U6LCB2_9EIME|nr:hypothetical protein, conserved [Eimeria brunetti]